MKINRVFRRTVLLGAPLFAGLVLLFHPVGGIPEPGKAVDVFGFVAPVADRFVLVHILLAPALGLLGLALYFLIDELHGRAATISRLAIPVFVVFYVAYESIVGTATGSFVRLSLNLPPAQQVIIADAASKLWADPIVGDLPALIPLIAVISWAIAVLAAAIALRQSGVSIPVCFVLVLSSALTIHVPPFGPIAMLCLFLAALWVERARASVSAARLPSPAEVTV